MNLNNIPFLDLENYPDNQFFSIEILDHKIVKKYEGQDWEKKLNLRNEYDWLKAAPTYLNYHFPKLLQEALDFKDNDHSVELHLSKIDVKSFIEYGVLCG